MRQRLELKVTTQFRKDFKAAVRRGYKMHLLETVLDALMVRTPLDERHRDHALTGDYVGFRECHIQPDWLLIYRVDEGALILTATRTGTHADLFGK